MSSQAKKTLFLGTFIHSKSLEELQQLKDCAVFVDDNGVIAAIEPNCSHQRAEEEIFSRLGWSRGDVNVLVANADQFFFPGFIGQSTSCSTECS